MTKIIHIALLASLTFTAATAETVEVDFTMNTNWRGEVIKLPPSFAPDMKTKGVEDIRFAPGMFKPDHEDFFSYLFVINSTTGQKFTDEKFLHSELLAYYKGLAKSVSRGAIDPRDFKLKLLRSKIFDDEKANFQGTLDWVEPFKTQKAQTLNFDLRITETNGTEYLFVCVSPQKSSHEIWKELFKVRDSFKVKAATEPTK
jgi:hypothetical protein